MGGPARGETTPSPRFLLDEAGRRGYRRLSLETGSMAYFEPARRLYAGFGFAPCEPFGPYTASPHNSFFTRELPPTAPPGDE